MKAVEGIPLIPKYTLKTNQAHFTQSIKYFMWDINLDNLPALINIIYIFKPQSGPC